MYVKFLDYKEIPTHANHCACFLQKYFLLMIPDIYKWEKILLLFQLLEGRNWLFLGSKKAGVGLLSNTALVILISFKKPVHFLPSTPSKLFGELRFVANGLLYTWMINSTEINWAWTWQHVQSHLSGRTSQSPRSPPAVIIRPSSQQPQAHLSPRCHEIDMF